MTWEGYTSRLCKRNDFNVNGLFRRDNPPELSFWQRRILLIHNGIVSDGVLANYNRIFAEHSYIFQWFAEMRELQVALRISGVGKPPARPSPHFRHRYGSRADRPRWPFSSSRDDESQQRNQSIEPPFAGMPRRSDKQVGAPFDGAFRFFSRRRILKAHGVVPSNGPGR